LEVKILLFTAKFFGSEIARHVFNLFEKKNFTPGRDTCQRWLVFFKRIDSDELIYNA